jgi:hypothetical protein
MECPRLESNSPPCRGERDKDGAPGLANKNGEPKLPK